ncbi:MAG: F0F1 ATP synthase subunit C [Defluviitaleaceae bacterium]|nr:F0F1 ATP synthase subunit C [Defluviitaleaceae bacterium]
MFNQEFSAVATTAASVMSGADPVSSIIVASIFAAAIAVLAGMAPSFMQGYTAARAVEAVGRQPEAAGQIRSTMIIGGVLAETGGVYGLLVSMLMIFVNPFVDMYVEAMRAL